MSVNLGRVAFVAKGSYNAATTYQQYDYVTHNNGSYVYISPIPAAGKPVTDAGYWQPLFDPAGVNDATAAANAAATQAQTNAQTAATAAETANTAAAAADEARLNIQSDLAQKAPAIFVAASGDLVHITDGAAMPVKSLITHIYPVQEGEGDPSPDNVRPISGWDSASAWAAGKNLAPDSYASYAPEGAYTVYKVNPTNAVISLSLTEKDSTVDVGGCYIGLVEHPTNIMAGHIWALSDGTLISSVIIASNFKNIFIYPATEEAFNRIFARYNVQVEFGSTSTGYEPYQGRQALTASLSETVYGGDKNWTMGLVTVTHEAYVLDGVSTKMKANTSNTGDTLFYIKTSGKYKAAKCCDQAPIFNTWPNKSVGCFITEEGLLFLNLTGRENKTNDEFNAMLAASPVTVICELTTPYTIQLTPQQLETLKGINNIWSDAGETAVTYAADTKMYADGKDSTAMIGTAEPGMIATKNYASGDFIVVGKSLYKATAAIATGETITPGTNCTATTVIEQLAAIYNLIK